MYIDFIILVKYHNKWIIIFSVLYAWDYTETMQTFYNKQLFIN